MLGVEPVPSLESERYRCVLGVEPVPSLESERYRCVLGLSLYQAWRVNGIGVC